jgi:hypothetical protein
MTTRKAAPRGLDQARDPQVVIQVQLLVDHEAVECVAQVLIRQDAVDTWNPATLSAAIEPGMKAMAEAVSRVTGARVTWQGSVAGPTTAEPPPTFAARPGRA